MAFSHIHPKDSQIPNGAEQVDDNEDGTNEDVLVDGRMTTNHGDW